MFQTGFELGLFSMTGLAGDPFFAVAVLAVGVLTPVAMVIDALAGQPRRSNGQYGFMRAKMTLSIGILSMAGGVAVTILDVAGQYGLL